MARAKVFLSYSTKDLATAKALHQCLHDADLDVWRAGERLAAGMDWSQNVAAALARSDVVCLIWSRHSAESEWVTHEWLTAWALDKLLIPCVCPMSPPLPEPLANLHMIAIAEDGSGFDLVVQSLIDRATDQNRFKSKHDHTQLLPNSYVPFNADPDFIGRENELLDLYTGLVCRMKKVGINQAGLAGMGGIGKTQLAVEFAYRFCFAFDGVYWISADDSDKWAERFVELSRDRLLLSVESSDKTNDDRGYLYALQRHCKRHPQMLVIMDNVGDPQLLNSEIPFGGTGFVPLALGCKLLFTTRRRFRLPAVTEYSIGVLSPNDALSLLTRQKAPNGKREEEAARRVCEAVGQLPLALVLANGYLSNYRNTSYSESLLS